MQIDDPARARNRRLAMSASYIGTTLEYYDFLLYGIAAALVFPGIFFVNLEPLAATLSAFATLAVGYFARPLGGVVFGHFGDKLGRKNVLVVTLLLMGVSSMLIGCLPSYQQIGVAAPVLLVALRLLQGIAMGGEWGGATLMSMEHARPKGRGLAVSIVGAGAPTGAVLGTLVMTPFSLLPPEQFLGWGWRVPFLLSAVLMAVGLMVRMKVDESPEFEAARKARDTRAGRPVAVPVLTVLRHNRSQVLSGVIGGLAPLAVATFTAAFLLNYAMTVGHSRTSTLAALTIANAVHIATMLLFGALSDRIGRRPVMIGGALAGIVLIWPVFLLVHQGSFAALVLALLLTLPLVQAAMGGSANTWISEKFAADVRYSGISLTFQIASVLGAGLMPLISASLLAASGARHPEWVAMFFAGICAASCLAYVFSSERYDQNLPTTTRTERPEDPAGERAPEHVSRRVLSG